LGNRSDHRLEVAQNLLMGKREDIELQKAVAEFIRKLEAGKRDMRKPEKRGKPAR
jgi:hypothetical protein